MLYHIATYGCQMNEYDSGVLAAMMESEGCTATDDPAAADFILVNTCSVRQKAEDTALARISKFKPFKRANPNLKIVLAGCMAKNHGESLIQKMPLIDYVIGPDHYRKIPEILFRNPVRVSRKNSAARTMVEFDSLEIYKDASAKLASPFSTYVAIQRGCNKHCSYCIVPHVRGPEKYRDETDVLREAGEAAARGVREITLLGQTVNAYRFGDTSFAGLLEKVSLIPGIERIRFTSPHPRHYTPELIDVLLGNPKICAHAHIPLQSGSNAMLKKMRRQHQIEDFLRITEKLRGANPLYGLTTDIICGFVGETESDFEQTLEVVREVQFDSAFMFIYSPREGTESAREPETLTEEEKKERHRRLADLQNEITLERNRMMIGNTERILVERPSTRNPEEWVGKTGNFKKVIFRPSGSVYPGAWANIHIDDIRGWTLRGTPVEE